MSYSYDFFQEESLGLGFAYILAVVSLFDEYANDLLYLNEGSCFPRYCVELGCSIIYSTYLFLS